MTHSKLYFKEKLQAADPDQNNHKEAGKPMLALESSLPKPLLLSVSIESLII